MKIQKKYIAGIAAGIFYILVGIFGVTLAKFICSLFQQHLLVL